MIYECPQCHAPQEAGQTACPHCHAQFDGPVPDDAIIPPAEQAALAEQAVATEQAVTAPITEAAPDPIPLAKEEPRLEEVKPPPAPASSQPYLTPPSYSPPAYLSPLPAPPAAPAPPLMRQPFGGLSRALLIAFPIVLVLVLGSIYFVNNLNTGSETVAETAPMPPVAMPPPVSPPAIPTPVGSPVYLQGGANTNNAGSDPRAKMLAGHWEAKSGGYYVFNTDGTGQRGSAANPQKDQSFLWGLVQNRLMLYMDKNETLRFNPGPDDNTIYLGAQTGHYVQYARDKS